MASPISAAYDNTSRSRTPYLSHSAPNLTFPGLDLAAHPDFTQMWPMWRTIRDCYEGEARIKSQGEIYLRKLTAHKAKDYEGFLSRAYFYNATRRTHEGLLGSLHRKPAEITLPPSVSLPLEDVTIHGESVLQFAKRMDSEVILMGRYGILVDLPNVDGDFAPDQDRPYMSGYAAESIYSWREVNYKGRRITDRVVLSETETVLSEYGVEIRPVVRVLRLDPDPEQPDRLVYSQEIIRPAADANQPPLVVSVPVTIRGRTLDYIPFVFVNVTHCLPAVETPPLMDIATINISHYQSTALLEHGRFYAGMPTYVVSAGSSEGADPTSGETLAVGPSNVWELEQGAKAWILEFNGHGLTFLENAVDSKQLQMQSLGGKLISAQRKAAALSSEAYSLMETGDEATLLNVAETCERALARALTIMADFLAIEIPRGEAIVVEMNKEFVRSELTARELRAIQALYTGGLIPLDVLYYALRSVNVIPIEYSLEDFTAMLNRPEQKYTPPAPAPLAVDPNVPIKAELDARAAQSATNNPRSGSGPD